MEAFGALFHHDATFVNRFATYTRGVDNMVALRRGSHETIPRDSTLENELIAVGQIAAGAAIVHFWSRLAAGVSHPAGPHLVDTLVLAVVTERDGTWRIQAAENVTLVDPMTGAARVGRLIRRVPARDTRPTTLRRSALGRRDGRRCSA